MSLCESQKKQDKAQLEFPREPRCRIRAGFTGLHPARKSVESNLKPSPGLPGQPQTDPQSPVPCSCPSPDFPHLIPSAPSAPWPPHLPFPCVPTCAVPSVPTSAMSRGSRRQGRYHSQQTILSPPHIFIFECQMWKTQQDDHSVCTLCLLPAGKSQQK